MKITSKIPSTLAIIISISFAHAAPTVSDDPVFTQSNLMGKVFHDRNGNGIQDLNEEGIPGARLATVTGLVAETDRYGRYHMIDTSMQSHYAVQGTLQNSIIKLDPASLPQGTIMTTENPRVLRGSGAGIDKVNFGVNF